MQRVYEWVDLNDSNLSNQSSMKRKKTPTNVMWMTINNTYTTRVCVNDEASNILCIYLLFMNFCCQTIEFHSPMRDKNKNHQLTLERFFHMFSYIGMTSVIPTHHICSRSPCIETRFHIRVSLSTKSIFFVNWL